MFTAGTDTTASTVEWAMTEILRHPHTMAKVKEELEEVIGKGKIIKEDDVNRLPYLSCIVKETFRVHPPAPLLLPRKVENEVKLNEYIIPKGTQVLVNAWAIGQDPTIWEDSLEFVRKYGTRILLQSCLSLSKFDISTEIRIGIIVKVTILMKIKITGRENWSVFSRTLCFKFVIFQKKITTKSS